MTDKGNLKVRKSLAASAEYPDEDAGEVDDLLESLPPKLKSEVLIAVSVRDKPSKPKPKMNTLLWLFLLFWAFIWAVPWMLVATVCFLTVIGIPFGAMFVGIGAAPFGWLVEGRFK